MSYHFLLFDLDHTLMDFDQAEEVALTELLKECQIRDIQAYKDYYKPMNQAMWKDLELKRISKTELVNTRFARLFDYFGQSVDGIYLAERYQEHLKSQGQTYPGASALLKKLSEAGFEIYAATNGITKIQNGRLQASDIKSYFKKVFISEQAASQKPDQAFYQWIGQQIAHFDKAKTLMIGDSLTADIQGGNRAHIDTVWYNPKRVKNLSQANPTYEVSSFEELQELLLKNSLKS
ncbi:YjjG family noncanonical pyrimidine nucleotidase [Streptococcus catagoni]|uniref:YjjG family noncanonical pyrimidine nucleotidase n=1 Tax=Streptococcus catagoni TaxID=2654874 RepID=UPI00140CBF5C|nr:YjjG family noncanonical pyrimidine nucleotidase [Streptococcus catagoni]